MGMFSSDEKEDIFRDNIESTLRDRVGELEVKEMNLHKEIDRLTKEKKELEQRLDNQKSTIRALLNLIGMNMTDNKDSEYSLYDFMLRQKRIFQNKVNHGFNTTNIYQEARYILEEVAELMRAVEKNDRENMIEELADIVIFSYGCAEVARLGNLDTKIFEKMTLNEKRVYEKNDAGDFIKTSVSE